MGTNPKGRSSIMCIIGCYLCYLGYSIGKGAYAEGETMPVWVSFLFAALFVVIGIGIIYYGYRLYSQAKKEKDADSDTEDPSAKS